MPSRIESGASQCTWTKETSKCSITEPPSDPIFIILVSLFTLILSIPILTLLMYVLDEYGSKEPGMKNADELIIKENKIAVRDISEGDGEGEEKEGDSSKSLSASASNKSSERDRYSERDRGWDMDRDMGSSILKSDNGSGTVAVAALPCSDFAQLIKRDATADFKLDRLSAAHFAYAGTYVHPSIRTCVCVCVCVCVCMCVCVCVCVRMCV